MAMEGLIVLAMMLTSTGAAPAAVWWSECPILDLTYPLSPDTTNYPLKAYAENRFQSHTIAAGTDFISFDIGVS